MTTLWITVTFVKVWVLVCWQHVNNTWIKPDRCLSEVQPCQPEVQIPKITVRRILHKWLLFKPYIFRLLEALSEVGKPAFCADFSARLQEEETLDSCLVFSNEAVFRLYGTVNKHGAYVGGSEVPNATVEYAQYFTKWMCPVEDWCLWCLFRDSPTARLLFHERALLNQQRCCQGHGAANAASRGDQRFSAAGSGCVMPRC
jgi:hypothetical protein